MMTRAKMEEVEEKEDKFRIRWITGLFGQEGLGASVLPEEGEVLEELLESEADAETADSHKNWIQRFLKEMMTRKRRRWRRKRIKRIRWSAL